MTTLGVDHDGIDVLLDWVRPSLDPAHGEAQRYRVYSSGLPTGSYQLLADFADASQNPGHVDAGAATASGILYYQVIANNPTGDSDVLP